MIQYEIKVSGRVQGVGFRYYAQKRAADFGLKGWVKNMADGSLHLVVQGEKPEVDTFVDYLRIGPTLSRVSKVAVSPIELVEKFQDFRIKY